VLFEVSYSDSYPNDMINQDVQEMQYPKQTHIDDFQDDEIHNNYDNESSDDDNDDDDVEKDEKDGKEEEHLAPVDPPTVPTDDPIPSS
ncbi:hypothetical protein Tco_1279943, partial [Tanacetum coccineum]